MIVVMELLEVLEEYEELEEELTLESDEDDSLDGSSSENWMSLSEILSENKIVPTSDICLVMTPFSSFCWSLVNISSDWKFSDVLRLFIDDIIDDNNLLHLSSFEVNKY